MNKTKINKLLNKYIEDKDSRYYNVIYWLDFGVSLPKKIVNSSAKLIFSNGY